tara:strand:+ start:2068 stop:2472 length:405 start_codon:yes stop_codon:yes gene_type:complete
MEIRSRSTYEVRVYLGSINEETLKSFSKKDLIKEIGLFQEKYSQTIPVRVTDTTFVSKTHYTEDGWEVAAINYPRVETESSKIDEFMKDLAVCLLDKFKQNRISIVMPDETLMIERSSKQTLFKWGALVAKVLG